MKWVKKEDSWRLPVKSWCGSVEPGAELQAANLASHPAAFHHIALMPDCHQGYGMPIGGVLALENAVCPNAVGVDIGCLDCDTEVLTPNGWIRIADYNGQKILQFAPENDKGAFLEPLAFIRKPCSFFYRLKNESGLDQVVSDEHNLLVYHGHKEKVFERLRVSDLYVKGSFESGYYQYNTCFNIIGKGVDRSDSEIRLEVMVQADGRIREYDDYNHVELHFKRDRKIVRAREILSECKIEYNEHKGKDGSTYFSFRAPKFVCKDLSEYYNASWHQLSVLADESLKWDGHEGERPYYSSTNKVNADLIQFAFTATNRRASICTPTHRDGENQVYVVTISKHKYSCYSGMPTLYQSKDGFKYCFTTQTGFFLCRRSGFTFLTGNCGMIAVQTDLNANEIADMSVRRRIQQLIKSRIPVGEGHSHAKPQEWDGFGEYEHKCGMSGGEWPSDTDKENLGSLGGGNHFIELQKDENNIVWLMIHSGSRNLGKRIADSYNKIAVDLCSKFRVILPDKDLAFLPADIKEGRDYLRDMNFALAYAKESRHRMMNTTFESLCQVCSELGVECREVWRHDIHHNYAALEQHFDRNVWVHRKGATRAMLDEVGIVPGSMGTASYIVRGLGNPESFCSCSHGSGRKMSRTDACYKLTVDECNKAMEGIVCDRWSKARLRGKKHEGMDLYDLSEAPGAYKDIDDVIASESDLVEPICKLKPLASIKG